MDPNSEVTARVKDLYNEVPYSAYGENYFPVVRSLGMGLEEFTNFARGKQAMEVGSGGGQLSIFLAGFFGSVIGVDISDNSLSSAKREGEKRNIFNLRFEQGNLFDDSFLNKYSGSQDFVLCYGVLHHTANPGIGYERLVKLLKPGGVLIVGVYSRTQIFYRIKRQVVLWLAGDDWNKREKIANKLFFKNSGRKVSLFDGYVHPQVSFHSIAEVFNWPRKAGLSYMGSWPDFSLLWYFNKLVKRGKSKLGGYNRFMFLMVELLWLLSGKSVMVSVAAKKD